MKVLHLPTSVGGHSWGLAQGEKGLGLDAHVLVDSANWLGYKSDTCLHLEQKNKLLKLWKRLETFVKLRKKYDVFHFNFGSSLLDFAQYGMPLFDLPYYHGKKIMTYNGCDARQKYPSMSRVELTACHDKDCYFGMCNDGKMDIARQRRIIKVEKYVDHIFALNPDLMHFLPPEKTSFLPYAIAGWDDIILQKLHLADKIKIVHSPTNRAAKGSDYILSALHNLTKKYPNIEVIVIEKIPYEQALMLYQEAHIVIDQVLIGWYGGFGVEVMKMGKPLAVFVREEDLKFIPKDMAYDLKNTIININPFNIEEVLANYIENPSLLFAKSQASLEYVHKWHNPKYVASLTKQVYEK